MLIPMDSLRSHTVSPPPSSSSLIGVGLNAAGTLEPSGCAADEVASSQTAPGALEVPVTLSALATAPRWVAWQTEDRPNGKPTKVPYSPSGAKARADTPRTWGTRAQAEAMAERLPRLHGQGGVGIELGELGGGVSLGGVDLNSCCGPGGPLATWAVEVVHLLQSYAETSPSLTGAKVFFTYPSAALAVLRARKLIDPGNGAQRKAAWGRQWKSGEGDHRGGGISRTS